MRQIDTSSIPTVTPPWLQPAAQPAQQQPAGQSVSAPKQKFDYAGTAGKLFTKPLANAISPYFGAGGAATGIGATTATGGTYVTGAGLAGTASPINTVAGAAGKTASSGFAGGLKGGLAAGAAGFAGGLVGSKLFGGHGGTGGSIGASIGFMAGGPLGAIAGSLFGGAFGGMFGGKEKRAHLGVNQGGGSLQATNRYGKRFDTDLGGIYITTGSMPYSVRDDVFKMFKESDAQVAQLFDQDQLARAKNNILNGERSQSFADWGSKKTSSRAEGVIQNAVKSRYAMAVGGLDRDFGGTFNRVAKKDNMGGLIETMAQMDRDISNKSGVFADFNPQANQSLGISAGDPRLKKTIIQRSFKGMAPITKEVANPQYDSKLAEQFKKQGSSSQITGYETYTTTERRMTGLGKTSNVQVTKQRPIYADPSAQGNQALEHLASKFGVGERPSLTALKPVPEASKNPLSGGVMNTAAIRDAKKHNEQAQAANDKKLAAWEKKVLDAYADNFGPQSAANNIASAGIERTAAQGTAAPTRSKLFGSVNQQSVKLNRAQPTDNESVNAGGLLSQSGAM